MPLTPPSLDSRTYQQLVDDALARIPVHNPDWTNFNQSDPGVTIVELFAFLTENLLYRANQIPERNRQKFLSLLGVPLEPPSSARGLVQITNERGPLQTVTLNADLEVRSGNIPFRTQAALDVLPVEGRVYFKRQRDDAELRAYYEQLYGAVDATSLLLYETVPLEQQGSGALSFGATVDNALWIALLARTGDDVEDVRAQLAGKTVNVGFVPALAAGSATLEPVGKPPGTAGSPLDFRIPSVPASGGLTGDRQPAYRQLAAASTTNVLVSPGVVQVELPGATELRLWDNLEPLEGGTGDLPPALEDSKTEARVVTWLRVQPPSGAEATLIWAGINCVDVSQRAHVRDEVLPSGNGEPDQSVRLSRAPVIPGSVRLTVTTAGESQQWAEIDDLLAAGPEIPAPDLRAEPGVQPPKPAPAEVFVVDPEAGELRFGDGIRGRRPQLDATLRASYDHGVGRAGNVARGTITTAPALPAGFKVTNPVRAWGGAEGETVAEGEKQIARYLQHRDRLVTAEDYRTLSRRAPGIDLGRIEVLPAFNPDASAEPGDAPGAVTLLVIPRYDATQPDAPVPDKLFLEALCEYLEPRRLVTTEVFLRGPAYTPIWISVGLDVVAGASIPQVREDVKKRLLAFLAPLPPVGENVGGWQLRRSVLQLDLIAEANRVTGVQRVNGLQLSAGSGPAEPAIDLRGWLDLPRVVGIAVVAGDPLDLDAVRGTGPAAPDDRVVVPVPVIPETC
jgi:hypothetical protein